MDIERLAKWAELKGIALMGTGDFTHHLCLEELRAKLEDWGNFNSDSHLPSTIGREANVFD